LGGFEDGVPLFVRIGPKIVEFVEVPDTVVPDIPPTFTDQTVHRRNTEVVVVLRVGRDQLEKFRCGTQVEDVGGPAVGPGTVFINRADECRSLGKGDRITLDGKLRGDS